MSRSGSGAAEFRADRETVGALPHAALRFARALEQVGQLDTVAAVRGLQRLAFSDAVSAGAWTVVDPDGRSPSSTGRSA